MSEHSHGSVPDPSREVIRFNVHQRLQHGLMALSFTSLAVTGWPLSTAGIGASRTLVDFFGGLEACGLIHRIAGIAMGVSALYHLGWLVSLLFSGRLRLSMLPSLKDFYDLVGNLMYFLGARGEKPRFPRYSYFEKFDYWAVFWGVAIMMGSGLIRWFPAEVVAVLPEWVYEIALHGHADEAMLAALAIFVWHFYNVHLRPAVFPMSWIFVTGRMTMAELEEEHGAEYDEIVRRLKASDAAQSSSPEDDAL